MSVLQFLEAMVFNVAVPVVVCGTLYGICWVKAKMEGTL
jgi:hypothetical protein